MNYGKIFLGESVNVAEKKIKMVATYPDTSGKIFLLLYTILLIMFLGEKAKHKEGCFCRREGMEHVKLPWWIYRYPGGGGGYGGGK